MAEAIDRREFLQGAAGDTIPPTPPCANAERNDPSRTYLGVKQAFEVASGLPEVQLA